MNYSILVFSFLYALFNVSGAAIIKNKLTMNSIVSLRDFIVFLFDYKIIFAMTLIFISMFFSIKALSIDKFSVVIPTLTGVNFILTVCAGYLFFKDELALVGYLGVLLIMLGIYFIGLGK